MVAGAVAAVSGIAAVAATGAATGAVVEDSVQEASDFFPDTTDANPNRNALVEGENDDFVVHANPPTNNPGAGATNANDVGVNDASTSETGESGVSDDESSTESFVGGLSSHASEPPAPDPTTSEPISIEQNVLNKVVGEDNLPPTDRAVFNSNRQVTVPINTEEEVDEAASVQYRGRAQSVGGMPSLRAVNGNWIRSADLFGLDEHTAENVSVLNWDDFFAFMRVFRASAAEGDD